MAADAPKTDLQFLEQFEPEVFWEEHGTKIMAGLLAAVVIGLGIFLWQKHAAERALAASTQVASAQSVADLERVVSDYSQLPAGAIARLKLADLHFSQGRYEDAARQYQALLERPVDGELAAVAQFGLAAVAEAQGELSVAQAKFEQVGSQSVNTFIGNSAKLGAARCAELQGEFTTARQLYEEVMAAGQRNPLANEALMRWTILGRQPTVSASEPSSPAVGSPATP